jgi:hypothetical protein
MLKMYTKSEYAEMAAQANAQGKLLQLIDGALVLVASPAPTPEELKQKRLGKIASRLAEIDLLSIRPLRAVADNAATEFDRNKLAALETETAALREEQASLLS